jgi:hypothetical protein
VTRCASIRAEARATSNSHFSPTFVPVTAVTVAARLLSGAVPASENQLLEPESGGRKTAAPMPVASAVQGTV